MNCPAKLFLHKITGLSTYVRRVLYYEMNNPNKTKFL